MMVIWGLISHLIQLPAFQRIIRVSATFSVWFAILAASMARLPFFSPSLINPRAVLSASSLPVVLSDAIHLASALEALKVYPDLVVLSFDKRILENLEPLGLTRAEAVIT